MIKRNYYVYIITHPGKTVLYTGVTNNLKRRLQQHRENRGKSGAFAGRYYCHKLIYYETYGDARQAIAREKEVNNMSRKKKDDLIGTQNPRWNFLLID